MKNYLANFGRGYDVYTDIRLEKISVKHKA